MKDEPRIAAWDVKVEWPLTGLAVAFLAGYAWQVLDMSLGPQARAALDLALTGVWVLLGVVTASIAAWFVENVRRTGEQVSEEVEDVSTDVEATRAQLADVLAELRTISARLDALERDRRPV